MLPLFDAAVAARYERWYETPAGRRAERAERGLLGTLLADVPPGSRVLDIGCGTGRFSRWLAESGYRVVGVDRSMPMLAAAQRRSSGPWVQGDAQALPIRDGACAAAIFVTALEFVPDPLIAVREALRVAEWRVVIVALSAWSLGWWLRRWRRSEGPIVAQARRWSPVALARLVQRAAARRPVHITWRTALAPRGLPDALPWGEVVATAARPPTTDD